MRSRSSEGMLQWVWATTTKSTQLETVMSNSRQFDTPVILAAALAIAALSAAVPAHSDSVSEFYTGKQVEFVIGYTVGAAYDTNGRVVARHLGRYIPGKPQVVVRNMPGAGSLVSS